MRCEVADLTFPRLHLGSHKGERQTDYHPRVLRAPFRGSERGLVVWFGDDGLGGAWERQTWGVRAWAAAGAAPFFVSKVRTAEHGTWGHGVWSTVTHLFAGNGGAESCAGCWGGAGSLLSGIFAARAQPWFGGADELAHGLVRQGLGLPVPLPWDGRCGGCIGGWMDGDGDGWR